MTLQEILTEALKQVEAGIMKAREKGVVIPSCNIPITVTSKNNLTVMGVVMIN